MDTKFLLFALLAALSLTSCSVPNNTTNEATADVQLDGIYYRTLGELILAQPGVYYLDGRFKIRGKTPYFVVDGVPVGGFNSAHHAVLPQDVRSIRVLAGSRTAAYGLVVGTPVVEITTNGPG